MDRPLGTKHPKWDMIYLVNYERALTEFQERYFKSIVIRKKVE